MVKQITVPCSFQNTKEQSPVNFYIGAPARDKHPLEFQSKWLGGKGGSVPQSLMDNLKNIHELALKNGVDFEELCFYLISNKPIGAKSTVNKIDLSRYTTEFMNALEQKDENTPEAQNDVSHQPQSATSPVTVAEGVANNQTQAVQENSINTPISSEILKNVDENSSFSAEDAELFADSPSTTPPASGANQSSPAAEASVLKGADENSSFSAEDAELFG
ncbi:MAG: hypothetical protein RL208_322 [Pseudomonadota bacterium]|jgi:hypothetical protein